MVVQPQKVKWRASDGTEFETEEEAERYDRLAVARAEWKRAKTNFRDALVATQKTKDGFPFELGKWGPYYFLTQYIGQQPRIFEVAAHFHDVHIDESCEASIYAFKTGYEDNRVNSFECVVRSYKISDLYYKKSNADAALTEALREYIAELQEDIAKRS